MSSTSSAPSLYLGLPAAERQEFRLPALLKEHLIRAAAQTGKSVTEYINATLAEQVTRDLAEHTDWALTVDEQSELMRILVSAPSPGSRARDAAARADKLFGPVNG